MERRDFLKMVCAGAAIGLLARADLAGAVAIPPDPAFNAVSKGLWVWQTSLADAAAVISLAKSYGFDTVFFSIPPTDRQTLFTEAGTGVLTNYLKEFRQNGIGFYAVSGDPIWCRDAAATPSFMPSAVTDLVVYQQRTALLDGLAFDIEPETLPEWSNCTGSACYADGTLIHMLKGYLNLLRNISAAYELATGTAAFTRPLIATVSPLYVEKPDPFRATKDLLVAAATSINGATQQGTPVLLAYHNSALSSVDYGNKATLELTDTVRDKWWFGQTVHPNPVPGVSYSAGTFTEFETEMVQLNQSLSTTYGVPSATTAYSGVAVNDYVSLLRMITNRP